MVPLPIELLSFDAIPNKESVVLKWITVSEINNEGFEVQHSVDGVTWETIGYKKGKGTSNEPIKYSIVHEKPSGGLNYYRLKQLDFDGKENLSPIVSAFLDKEIIFQLYPNPCIGQVQITSEIEVLQVLITDTRGIKIRSIKDYKSNEWVDVSYLSPGVYVVHVFNGSRSIVRKFEKL